MKYCELGRSMVEMLGVLAIIGVLSVGAIAGYSKAMLKYRLNKQAEQLNTVFNAVARYHSSFSNITTQNIDLVSYFIKMGEIPTEMIKDGYLYDIFKTPIIIRTGYTSIPTIVVELRPELRIKSEKNLEICRNIFVTARENSDNIYYTRVFPNTSFNQFFGDNDCNTSNKCLRTLSLDDIYTACTNITEEGNANIVIVWKI